MDKLTEKELEDLVTRVELKKTWERRLEQARTALAAYLVARDDAHEQPENAPYKVDEKPVTKVEFLGVLDQRVQDAGALVKRIQARIGSLS